ncbi:hypothetical protein Z968_09995 [Clostridium novyi A str. 4552]|uniref:DUF3888 domain-containing protein n=2 Tax=Clostridium novyi TaxID=1542 RepID=A0A0A0I0X8_CLONO|nr:hypothetical protein Z968_09995 [Clostridium novyi A str. 4552]
MDNMKKAIIGLITVLTIFFSINPKTFALSKDVDKNAYDDFLITLLGTSIVSTLNEYYGEPRVFNLKGAKILEVKKVEEDGLYFVVTVTVRNSDRKTNSKNAIDTMILANTSDGVHVLDFRHIDEPTCKTI